MSNFFPFWLKPILFHDFWLVAQHREADFTILCHEASHGDQLVPNFALLLQSLQPRGSGSSWERRTMALHPLSSSPSWMSCCLWTARRWSGRRPPGELAQADCPLKAEACKSNGLQRLNTSCSTAAVPYE